MSVGEGAVPADFAEVDVVIVGAGAAGPSMAHHLCAPGGRPLSVVVVDAPPGRLSPPRRTWCFWEPESGPYDASLTASWSRLRVRAADGGTVVAGLPRLRYKMLRSDDFEALVHRRLSGAPGVRRVAATVSSVRDIPGGGAEVHVQDRAGERALVRGRYVFDSRPPRVLPSSRTTLLQHFTGWFVRAERPVVAGQLRSGMPLRVPPAHGLRARAMDAVMLRALDTGRIDGPDFFSRLFRGVPVERLLTFLDGGSRWHEDLLIGARTPVVPMLRTVAELPFVPRRPPRPLPPPPLPPEESSS